MKSSVLSAVLISCLVLLAVAVQRPRGVSLEKASFYQADKEFHCLSDGKVFPFDHVNDDYCDCEDGSDEPGTSACANGLFYCENRPYKGVYVLSSRVNDGICDCCDGSDEFSGIISCPNTCMERYEQEKAELEVLRRNQAEGYKLKQEYMQQGKRAKDEKLSKLSELEKEKDILNNEKEVAEVTKNEAEEPEKVAKEEHKKAWDLVKEERQKAKDATAAAQAFATLDANKDGSVDYPELMKHSEFDIDSDGTVSEEEAREYLEESEQADLPLFTEKIWPNIKEIYKPDQPEEESEEPAVQQVDESDVAEDDKEPEYDEETKRLIAVADEAREKFDDADKKLRDHEQEISDIKKYLEIDFGPNEEYSSLKGQCFEHTDREYTYRLCPFDKSTQKSKNGGIETSLGNWGKWHGPGEDKHGSMMYENGQGCWNGPSRSTHVNLHCGPTNEVTSATEPSRCEYQFEFTTPARCDPPIAGESNDVHDEL